MRSSRKVRRGSVEPPDYRNPPLRAQSGFPDNEESEYLADTDRGLIR